MARRSKGESSEEPAIEVNPGRMDLDVFATEYRRKVQGHLWDHLDKITIADLVRLSELERESAKRAESRRAKELRVVWINEKKAA
jgi:hypothetical protein